MSNKQLYVAYFAIDPYGGDVPARAVSAARKALEDELGGAWQVLAAKTAFEDAGGLPAFWGGHCPPTILRWTNASQAALNAAYRVEQPRQATIEDLEQLNEAYIDVIAAARYAYSSNEWLSVFTAHFGMSDHCESPEEALIAARRWLASAPGACPIAAADQQVRDSYRSRAMESSRAVCGVAQPSPVDPCLLKMPVDGHGAWVCN